MALSLSSVKLIWTFDLQIYKIILSCFHPVSYRNLSWEQQETNIDRNNSSIYLLFGVTFIHIVQFCSWELGKMFRFLISHVRKASLTELNRCIQEQKRNKGCSADLYPCSTLSAPEHTVSLTMGSIFITSCTVTSSYYFLTSSSSEQIIRISWSYSPRSFVLHTCRGL